MKDMTEIVRKIDLWQSNANTVIVPVQNDAGSRFLACRLTSEGRLYNIPDDTTAMLGVRKSDETVTLTIATITNGIVVAELTNQTLAITGIADAQIILYHGEEELKTPPFKLNIAEQLIPDGTVESSDEFSALTELLNNYSIDSKLSTTSTHPLQNKVIAEEFEKFFEVSGTGKNLFNPDDEDIVVGKIFNDNGELTVSNASFMTSGYIEVEEGERYVCSVERNGSRNQVIRSYCAYEEDKSTVVAASGSSQNRGVIVIPDGAKYIRVSTYSTNYGGSNWQFEKTEGDSTSYEKYHYIYDLSEIVTVQGANSIKKIVEPSSITLNLFNKNVVADGIITDTGIVVNSAYKASDFIYIGNGKNLACSWVTTGPTYPRTVVFYAEDHSVIASYNTSPTNNYPESCFLHAKDANGRICTIIPIPSETVYVRVSLIATSLDDYMIYTLGENELSRPADYIAFNSGYVNKTNLRIGQPNYIKSYFNGKKAVFIGDSITAGYSLVVTEKPFPAIVSSNLNMSHVNYGIGGSEIAQFEAGNNTYNPMCIRYADMDDDADLIIIAGGTNDWSHNHTQLGVMGDTSINTFYGALDTMCKGLLAKYHGKTIVFMTPIKRDSGNGTETGKEYFSPNALGYVLKDFVDAIKKVCEFYGIPVIDMYADCSLNPIIPVIRSNYFSNDGSHPNRIGQMIMARRVTAGIQALCQSTYEI